MQTDTLSPETQLIHTIQELLDSCLFKCIKQSEKVIFVRKINPYSLYRMYHGAIGKSYKITDKTERSGPLAGLINSTCPKHSQPAPLLEKESCSPNLSNVLVDTNGRFITSDLDVVMILSKTQFGKPYFSQDMGYINKEERGLIESINHNFREKLTELNPIYDYAYLNIIMHGSFNIFPKSQQSFLEPPLIAYSPCRAKIQFSTLDELSVYLKKCEGFGFKIDLNENWSIQ